MPWQTTQNNWELRVLFPVGNNRSEIGAKKRLRTALYLAFSACMAKGRPQCSFVNGKNGHADAGGPHDFVTTRWSLILSAAKSDNQEQNARNALAELCRTYWRPIFSFVCARGYSTEDAQDLTQDFFAIILKDNWLQHADRSRGRFRSLLLSHSKTFSLMPQRKLMRVSAAVRWNLFHGTTGQRKSGRIYLSPRARSIRYRRSECLILRGLQRWSNMRFNGCAKNAKAKASSGFSNR